MEQVNPRLTINLRAKKSSEISSVFLKWAINTGRIIIIMVEFLALGALSYRFIIDQQIVDLHDQIKREQIFVNAQAKKEAQYRALQKRLTNIQTVSLATDGKVSFLQEVLRIINTAQFTSTNLNVNDNSVTIDGQTVSIFNISSLVDKLKANPGVASISVDELASSEQGIRFKLTAVLVGSPEKL